MIIIKVVSCRETVLVSHSKLGDNFGSSLLIRRSDHYSFDPNNGTESLEPWQVVYLDAEVIIKQCQTAMSHQKFPHPANCAWYLDCTVTPDAVMRTFFSTYVSECPYPQMFSDVTRQCEYRANQCQESSHCVPCWVRYASCIGKSEGLNPVSGMAWQPAFVECHKERTVFQGSCNSGTVFSPVTRACETPLNIPTLQGGWKPSCQGRRDGLYPDHRGQCDTFFRCQGQLFRGLQRCSHSGRKVLKSPLAFNPFSSNCEPLDNVPYPCGNRDENNDIGNNKPRWAFGTKKLTGVINHDFCWLKPDGRYMDIFGRCSHYFICKKGSTIHFKVCPSGIFNVMKRECDDDKTEIFRQPRPCGEMENPCLDLPDGAYEQPSVRSCSRKMYCERGFVIAVKSSCK
ncbi:hypothetical protein PoB_000899000 [Plakobranchus ocellatus]|uniref:Chitin-binding type-2 domain-containing protein n=1 Tax=Plakobranchus ocellatus TaxID=259542 RepID=A0AAV3YIC3_9GAST|nr:hypothetical protein PoB_000899000 [Plakobranchus ocellatus]